MVPDAPPAQRLVLRPVLATTPDSLQALSTAELQDGALAFVTAVAAGGTLSGFYRWALGDTTAPSPPNVIADALNTGRWIALPGGGGGGVTGVTGSGGVIVDPTTGAVVVAAPYGTLVRNYADLSAQYTQVGAYWQIPDAMKQSGDVVLPAGEGIEVTTGSIEGIGSAQCSITGTFPFGAVVQWAAGAGPAELKGVSVENTDANGFAVRQVTRAVTQFEDVAATAPFAPCSLTTTSGYVQNSSFTGTDPGGSVGVAQSNGGAVHYSNCTFTAPGVGANLTGGDTTGTIFEACTFAGPGIGLQRLNNDFNLSVRACYFASVTDAGIIIGGTNFSGIIEGCTFECTAECIEITDTASSNGGSILNNRFVTGTVGIQSGLGGGRLKIRGNVATMPLWNAAGNLVNCDVADNEAVGGVVVAGVTGQFSFSSFRGNTDTDLTNGRILLAAAAPIADCNFCGNNARIIAELSPIVTLDQCAFSGNNAQGAPAINSYIISSPVGGAANVNNTALAANTADTAITDFVLNGTCSAAANVP